MGCFQAFVPKRFPCTAQPLKELDIYQFEISLAKKRERERERERQWEEEAGGRLQTNSSLGTVEERFTRQYWEVI